MKNIIVVLICTCLWGGAHPQDTDSPPTSAPSSMPSHADVQIVYTDEFMKVIEKYGITDDDIMYVTNKFKEGKPPTITKMVKDEESGDEKMIEVDLKNFIAGGHVTDLTPILEPEASESNITVIDVTPTPEAPTSPTAEEVLADLRAREQDLLLQLEKNRQEYERIAQALMDVRREIALNTPDEYDILSEEPQVPVLEENTPGSPFSFTPREAVPTPVPTPVEDPIELRQIRLRALRQALIRDAVRRHLLRRRMALMTGFPTSSSREFIIQPTRTQFIPVRRLGAPFFIRVNRRLRVPLDTTQLPIVADQRNPEIQTRPFEPIPRVTNIVVDTGDDTTDPDPIPQ